MSGLIAYGPLDRSVIPHGYEIEMRYKQRKDEEGFEVPSGQIYRIACCDCGLVHDFVFVSEDGKPIGIAARRNNRATAQRRRTIKASNAD